jgi:hypothetical protein
MSDTKISALPAAAPLTGTEPVPVVQGATTVQTTASAIAALSGGGSAVVKQVSVTLPSPARKSHSVSVTDATVTGASKIVLALAGTDPSAVNEIEDIEMFSMGAVPGAGSFLFKAGFNSPISGPILLNYMVG